MRDPEQGKQDHFNMLVSRFFMPILRDAPKEAEIVSHQLMLRAGMIRQSSSGIYSWLPLGKRVLDRIAAIVREEQDRAGAVEMLMPTIQSAELWRESGRYDDYGAEMLRIKDRHEREMLYGPTNEEMITALFRDAARSYRDVPRMLYHIQWKFRDEIRPRFGVMRGREFLMKDGYSFDMTVDEAKRSYQRMFVAYLRTFERLGLKAIPMRADTGPIGGDLSHEFIILAATGESAVFCHKDLIELPAPPADVDYDGDLAAVIEPWLDKYAATEEKHDAAEFELRVPADRRIAARGIEVGHIFFFGTKYTEPMKCTVQGPNGGLVPLQCGSYGIGVSRLVAAIIEASHDSAGIVWPDSVAPFDVGLVNLKAGDAETDAACQSLYEQLGKAGLDVLYDDTDERPGAKFKTMDLIGLPWQVRVGPRGLKDGRVELTRRQSGETQELALGDVVGRLRHG
jgi:prolyl-tRNA synthetase